MASDAVPSTQEVGNTSAYFDVSISKKKLYPLLLLASASEIDGTTRFHKLMFILKQEYGVPIDQKFIKYHYGPFSSDLRDDINFFVENGFVDQKSEFLGEDGNGFPVIKTTYCLSEKGNKIASEAFDDTEKGKFAEVVSKWKNASLKDVIAHAKSLL